MTVWMADQGCDRLVHAGRTATVFVDVRGEDDCTQERLEVVLRMSGWGKDGKDKWSLASIVDVVARPEDLYWPAGPPAGQDGPDEALHNGGRTSVVWQVRVAYGDTVAWRRVGVLDPEGLAGRRDEPSPSLMSFLGSLDTGR